ncbi:hypothetical protein BDV59DRAFT_186109 [Aspergillus ambiguus]|uniref:uncharacterized protein n=1 Tax=Aspergillus ambiguus TaxID=176160 RepID=UPI003CCE484C
MIATQQTGPDQKVRRHYFLRSVGFEIPPLLWQRKRTREHPKPVLRKSRYIAVLCCRIYILPVLALTIILTINLPHLYLGCTIPGPVTEVSVSMALF